MEMKERLAFWLSQALTEKVSDIHFKKELNQPIQMEFRTSMGMVKVECDRVDERLFHYLMYLAHLDVSQAYLPQSGSFDFELDGKRINCRFAVIQSHHQQSAVLRILNPEFCFEIEELSLNPKAQDWMREMIQKKSGFVLFSGLTGSGKTTTMYSLLKKMKGKKIFSLEDPVEIYYDHMVQLQVGDALLSYEEGIKQLLRHDPDVILIGEIRDSYVAKMALRCALTGHLVFSSIHASSASLAISRMEELGVSSSQLQEVLLGVSCQQLCLYQGHKQAIFEVMDQKELRYYEQNQCHSQQFKNLDCQKAILEEEITFL